MNKIKYFMLIILIIIFSSALSSCVKDVNVDTDGGSQIEYTLHNNKLSYISEPVKCGFTFMGWYLDRDFNVPFTKKTVIKKDTKLYAKYLRNKKTLKYVFDNEINTFNLTYNKLLKVSDPIKMGYNFEGWYLDNTYSERIDLNYENLESGRVYYPKWLPKKYKITFHINGKVIDNEIYCGDSIVYPELNVDGHHIKNWYQDINMNQIFDHDVMPPKDFDLYCKKELNDIAINVENVVFPKTEIKIKYGDNLNRLSAPECELYEFKGWYSDENYQTEINKSSKIYKETTVYAKWESVLETDILDNKVTITGIKSDCNINKLVIPKQIYVDNSFYTVEKIGQFAFEDNSLLEIDLSNTSIKSIGKSAFSNCLRLKSIKFNENLNYIYENAFDNTFLFNQSPNNSLFIVEKWILGYKGIVEYINEPSIKGIIEGAFKNNINLENIYNLNVETIPCRAFKDCINLKSVFLNYTKTIKSFAFENCKSLNKIDLPNTLESIDNFGLASSSISTIIIPKNVDLLGYGVFYNCNNLIDIVSNNVNYIVNDNLLYDSNYNNLYAYPLNNKNVTELIVNAENILPYTFYGNKNLKSIILNDTVLQIGDFAFSKSIIENINLNKVRQMGKSAFESNFVIKKVDIPHDSLLNEFDENVFKDCINLSEVDFPADIITIDKKAFYNTSITSVIMNNNVEFIYESAFEKCNKLNYCKLSNKLLIIDSRVFYNDINLIELNFDDNNVLKKIGDKAFLNCIKLYSLIIPQSVTEIGESAFMNCTELAIVELSNNIVKLSDNLFRNCKGLVNINIPTEATQIGNKVFCDCTNLKFVNINSKLFKIGNNAFENCKSLLSLNLKNVEILNNYVFIKCFNLETITIENTNYVLTLETNVFPSNLEEVFVPTKMFNDYINHSDWSNFTEKIKKITE